MTVELNVWIFSRLKSYLGHISPIMYGRMVICGLKLSEIQKRVIASLPKMGTGFPNEDPVSQMGAGGPVFLKGTWRVETAILKVMKGPCSLKGDPVY